MQRAQLQAARSILRAGKLVGSVSLQGREFPDQRRKRAGFVHANVLRILGPIYVSDNLHGARLPRQRSELVNGRPAMEYGFLTTSD
jgi:hypothetical protein